MYTKGNPNDQRFFYFSTIDVLVSSKIYFHPFLSYGMSTPWLLVHSFQGLHLGFKTSEGLMEGSRTPLSFALRIAVELFSSCLYLFDATIESHAMDEKKVQWPSHWKLNVDFHCNKGLFSSRCIICIFIIYIPCHL